MEIPLVNGDDELLASEDESDCELDLAGVNCVGDLAAVSSAQDRGRLIIWYIVITNFKSFAGTRTLGPFHEKVNAVVGPNGSGKSNVIDAILFVFGLKGYKLRAKNAASVIHCSEKFPNLDSCTVELHFRQIIEQNEERFEVVPDSKITISRTVNKDNVSFYKMNGSVAKFDTIKMFLKSHGVDIVSGRYLILQGEVEQISLMKPKAANEKEIGFLEYLEDIFGSLKYKLPAGCPGRRRQGFSSYSLCCELIASSHYQHPPQTATLKCAISTSSVMQYSALLRKRQRSSQKKSTDAVGHSRTVSLLCYSSQK